MRNITGVIKKTGEKPGKTIAIFAGVHGNERAGIMVVEYLAKSLKVTAGTVYFVYANQQAIQKNARFIKRNLNRCFVRKTTAPTCYEEQRAVELMDILDTCDALLDLHSYNALTGITKPFAICEPDCFDIVKDFAVPIVVSGIDSVEKGGTDGYMYNTGKYGICVELGAIDKPEEFVGLGIDTAYRFMKYFGCVDGDVKQNETAQIQMRAQSIYKKETNDFSFTKAYKTFDKLTKGECIAIDGKKNIFAEEDGYILFPSTKNPIGVEVFIFAK